MDPLCSARSSFGTLEKKEPKDRMTFSSFFGCATVATKLAIPNALDVILHQFNPYTQTYKILEETQITVHEKIGEGTFRHAFKVRKGNDPNDYVLKTFREKHLKSKSQTPEELSKLYAMKNVQGQMFARRTSEAFNSKCGNSLLRVLETALVEFHSGYFGTLEPFLYGRFKKYYNNDMSLCQFDNSPVYQKVSAFAHFSWEYSRHEAIITDLQGVGTYITDPEIATKRSLYNNKRLFNMGNWGPNAITKFGKEHKCNEYCQRAGVYGKPIVVGMDPASTPRPVRSTNKILGLFKSLEHQCSLYLKGN